MYLRRADVPWTIMNCQKSNIFIHSDYLYWNYKSCDDSLGNVNYSHWINFVKRN